MRGSVLVEFGNSLYGLGRNLSPYNLQEIDTTNPANSVHIGSHQPVEDSAGLGSVEAVSGMFRLPSIIPPHSDVVAIIRT